MPSAMLLMSIIFAEMVLGAQASQSTATLRTHTPSHEAEGLLQAQSSVSAEMANLLAEWSEVEAVMHAGEDCYSACGSHGGYCSWCGEGNACCRGDGFDQDPNECKRAKIFSPKSHHQCVKVPQAMAAAESTAVNKLAAAKEELANALLEAEKAAAEEAALEKAATVKAAEDTAGKKVVEEKVNAEKTAAEKAAADKVAAEKAAAEKAAAEKAAAEQANAEKSAAQRASEKEITERLAAQKQAETEAEKIANKKWADQEATFRKAADEIAAGRRAILERAAAEKAEKETAALQKMAAKKASAEILQAVAAASQGGSEKAIESLAAKKAAASVAAVEKEAEARRLAASRAAAEKLAAWKRVEEAAVVDGKAENAAVERRPGFDDFPSKVSRDSALATGVSGEAKTAVQDKLSSWKMSEQAATEKEVNQHADNQRAAASDGTHTAIDEQIEILEKQLAEAKKVAGDAQQLAEAKAASIASHAVVERTSTETAAQAQNTLDKTAADKAAAEMAAAVLAAKQRLAAERTAAKAEKEKAAEDAVAAQAVAQKAEQAKAEEEAAAAKAASEKAAEEKVAAEKAAAEKSAIEKAIAEKALYDKLAMQQPATLQSGSAINHVTDDSGAWKVPTKEEKIKIMQKTKEHQSMENHRSSIDQEMWQARMMETKAAENSNADKSTEETTAAENNAADKSTEEGTAQQTPVEGAVKTELAPEAPPGAPDGEAPLDVSGGSVISDPGVAENAKTNTQPEGLLQSALDMDAFPGGLLQARLDSLAASKEVDVMPLARAAANSSRAATNQTSAEANAAADALRAAADSTHMAADRAEVASNRTKMEADSTMAVDSGMAASSNMAVNGTIAVDNVMSVNGTMNASMAVNGTAAVNSTLDVNATAAMRVAISKNLRSSFGRVDFAMHNLHTDCKGGYRPSKLGGSNAAGCPEANEKEPYSFQKLALVLLLFWVAVSTLMTAFLVIMYFGRHQMRNGGQAKGEALNDSSGLPAPSKPKLPPFIFDGIGAAVEGLGRATSVEQLFNLKPCFPPPPVSMEFHDTADDLPELVRTPREPVAPKRKQGRFGLFPLWRCRCRRQARQSALLQPCDSNA